MAAMESPVSQTGQGESVSIQKNYTTVSVLGQELCNRAMEAIMGRETLPVYSSFSNTGPAKKINLSEFVRMVQDPRIGPKDNTTPALTPFDGNGKTKDFAQSSLYHALLIDHDHDDKDSDGIKAIYDPYDIAYLAFTTSSHQQGGKGNRWKVFIPFCEPIGFALWVEVARGAALMMGADLAQARVQQVFFAPNKLYDDAPYESILCLDRPFIDPVEAFHPFVNDCLVAYTNDQKEKQKQAKNAPVKARQINGFDGSIIEKVNQAFRMDEVLQSSGYLLKGKKYLSPQSESGDPGVIILNRDGKETVYSHHGPADPLSNLNHNGHALDVFDVLCILRYGGDVSRAIRELAPQVDPEGQKQRQREYAEQRSKPEDGPDNQGDTIDPSKTAARAEQILKDRAAPAQFDMNNLPDDFRAYVKELCDRTNTDPIVIIMSVLTSISALVGVRAFIPEGVYFSKLFCVLWTLVQDGSGAFKTTGLNKGSRLIWQRVQEVSDNVKMLKQEKESLGKDSDRYKEIETAIQQAHFASPLMPNKASGEGLLQLMANERRGAILCSEFGEWLSNMGKTHNTGLKPLFTELYDVPQQYNYMTRGGGNMQIEYPFVSIMGLSTPQWIHENINIKDVGSGFFARFMLFAPPEKRVIPPALPRYTAPIDTAFEQKVKLNLNSLEDGHAFGLNPEAREAFKSIHQGIYEAMAKQCTKEEQALLDPYAKRWSPYVLKIAMLFQILDDPEKDIGIDSIIPAAALVDYAMESTIFLFRGDLGLSPFQRNCEAVLKFIAKKGGDTTRQVLLSSKILQGGAKEYDDVLTMLGDGGKISIQPGANGKEKRHEKLVII